jgi:hypothetical protein
MIVSNRLIKEIKSFCKDYNSHEIAGIWLLDKQTQDGEPRIVIASGYKADSVLFLEIEGNISRCFTNEAKRTGSDGNYVGGAVVYHLEEDIQHNTHFYERGVSLYKELTAPQTICLYKNII